MLAQMHYALTLPACCMCQFLRGALMPLAGMRCVDTVS